MNRSMPRHIAEPQHHPAHELQKPRSRRTWVPALLALTAVLATLVLLAPVAQAGNGHFIHGVGPVNSSMGGAGVALAEGPVAGLYLNPALLTRVDGHQVEIDVEFVETTARTESTVQTPFGAFSGSTEDEIDLAVIPSAGWARGVRDGGKVAYGFGFLGLAGFGSDFPQDSSNPIFLPQPQGFGGAYSSYRMMKIPATIAWQINDRFSLGVALNGGYAQLAAAPFGGAAPDCSGPTTCFFPSVQEDGAFGYGVAVGVLYQATPSLALGAAYNSEMEFEDFEWNHTVANPNLPTFGTRRVSEFQLNVPQTFTAGIGWTPTPDWSVALDARWVNYEDTQGFGSGFDPRTGAALGLGWDDIMIYALGVEWQANPTIALRAGYNRSEAAVSSAAVFGNIASPAIFEDHLTLGLGWQATSAMTLNLAYYKVFENDVTGPFQSPAGPVPGTSVTRYMEIDSFLAGFTFDF